MDWSPILISMKTASVSIVITFFFGDLAAWWVVSLKNERMKIIGRLADAAAGAAAYGGRLFPFISVWGETANRHLFLQYFGVKIAFSWTATVLAAVVMSFPLMYRSARGAFEQVDSNLMAAARTLGHE